MNDTQRDSQDPNTVRLAIIGDLHDHWSEFDAEYLNGSDYDGVFFVGDLGRGEKTSLRISRSITRLERPTLVMPGNADAPHADSLDAEFCVRRGMDRLFEEQQRISDGLGRHHLPPSARLTTRFADATPL